MRVHAGLGLAELGEVLHLVAELFNAAHHVEVLVEQVVKVLSKLLAHLLV